MAMKMHSMQSEAGSLLSPGQQGVSLFLKHVAAPYHSVQLKSCACIHATVHITRHAAPAVLCLLAASQRPQQLTGRASSVNRLHTACRPALPASCELAVKEALSGSAIGVMLCACLLSRQDVVHMLHCTWAQLYIMLA